jgi:hypothetical protein
MRAAGLATGLAMLPLPLFGEQVAAPAHAASVKKPGDSLAVAADQEATRLVIVSGSGIGAATVVLAAQDWGKPLVLEFRYADGRGFAMLEHLVLTTPRLKIQGQLDGTGRLAFYWADGQGRFAGELENSGFVRVQVERLPTGMRVVLPANMLDRDAKLELEWIDAYR